MAQPYWKNSVITTHDPAIVAFETAATDEQCNKTNEQEIEERPKCGGAREPGIIEKLCHSFGFIQCSERDARLFFHFSEYIGSADELQIGESVEFEMSYDRRTGKPVACVVTSVKEVLSEGTILGTVITMPTENDQAKEQMGSISYEKNGAYFFLPFSMSDLKNDTKLIAGAQVMFRVSTLENNSNTTTSAKEIELPLHLFTSTNRDVSKTHSPIKMEPAVKHNKITNGNTHDSKENSKHGAKALKNKGHADRSNHDRGSIQLYQGVVCSMKESYGFIERADVVKEIFFHFTEYLQGNPRLGDDVEFTIQKRNNKEVATNVNRIPEGTVIFEDIALEHRRGTIQRTLDSVGKHNTDALPGRIVYQTVQGPIEIPYGDKDQLQDYTLQMGDIVEFNIATDRRDELQRATNITLVEDTFKISGEKRETGVISVVKDAYGFITCAERDAHIFFRNSEVINETALLQTAQEVEFTVKEATQSTKQMAIRIKFLPKGSVPFEITQTPIIVGSVANIPSNPKNAKTKDVTPGIILYEVKNIKQTIPYNNRAVIGPAPNIGDQVEFQICESRRNETRTAVNVLSISSTNNAKSMVEETHQGFIATLKDTFGFIELADHNKEVFFHFSAFKDDPSNLDLCDEVEFVYGKKTNKVSAENIQKLPKGTVAPEDVLPEIYSGKILRSMRIINPDQEQYPGMVEKDETGEQFPFGVTSLVDKRDFLQKGEEIKFQIAIVRDTLKKRATNISAVRKYIQATVESVKGQFGFLDYDAEPNKKLFFHMSEVMDNADLAQGDTVEFVLMLNQRNGKYSATNVRKMEPPSKPRPDHLISRLKSQTEKIGPRVNIIRQPKAPDGTKGFTLVRDI